MRTEREPASGLSLVELLVSMGVLTTVTWALLSISGATSDVVQSNMSSSQLQSQARRTLDRLVEELRSSGLELMDPRPAAPLSTSSLTFRRPIGYANGVVWGAPRRIHWERDPREIDDGVDNDGDGLSDEGRVVFSFEGEETVLCQSVPELLEGEVPNDDDDNGNDLFDEPGLCFVLDGPLLTIRLSTAAVGEDGQRVVRTVESAVTIRN